jgi:hypothetical protein
MIATRGHRPMPFKFRSPCARRPLLSAISSEPLGPTLMARSLGRSQHIRPQGHPCPTGLPGRLGEICIRLAGQRYPAER